MKRSHWVTLVVTALAAAAMALLVAGGASATPNPGWGAHLTLSPNPVAPTGMFTASGNIFKPGMGHELIGKTVYIDYWMTDGCKGEPTHENIGHDTSEDGGVFSIELTAPAVAGLYSYQAHFYAGESGHDKGVSDCMALHVVAGSVAGLKVPTSSGPDRYGYCTVTGNANPFTGLPYGMNTFVNLLQDQPVTDDHYKGATPAFWVEGVGITCDLTPAQAALAAASTTKVNHVGVANNEEGPTFYTFVPAP